MSELPFCFSSLFLDWLPRVKKKLASDDLFSPWIINRLPNPAYVKFATWTEMLFYTQTWWSGRYDYANLRLTAKVPTVNAVCQLLGKYKLYQYSW